MRRRRRDGPISGYLSSRAKPITRREAGDLLDLLTGVLALWPFLPEEEKRQRLEVIQRRLRRALYADEPQDEQPDPQPPT